MNIWILQTGEPLFSDDSDLRPMRAMNLSKALIERNHKVEIISTRFFHQKKIFRNKIKKTFFKGLLTETLINSPGYTSNQSLRRLFDHFILFFTLLNNLLKRKDKPDLLFIGYPPVFWSLAAIIFANIKGIPTLLDVKDLWPDIFWDNGNYSNTKKKIIKFVFIPYSISATISATFSKYITGPTTLMANYFLENYHNNLLSNLFNLQKPKVFASPIVPPKGQEIKTKKVTPKDPPNTLLKIFFIGSLVSVYDFETVSQSLNLLDSYGIKYKFLIAGKGSNEKENLLFGPYLNVG